MLANERVYEAVVNAGRWVDSAEIADLVGATRGTAQAHLTKLASRGKIVRHKDEVVGGNKWQWMYVYENGKDIWKLPGAPQWTSVRESVYQTLYASDREMTTNEIAKSMGKGKSSVRMSLIRLHIQGRVRKRMEERVVSGRRRQVLVWEAVEPKPEEVRIDYHSPLDDWWAEGQGSVRDAIERNWGRWCGVVGAGSYAKGDSDAAKGGASNGPAGGL